MDDDVTTPQLAPAPTVDDNAHFAVPAEDSGTAVSADDTISDDGAVSADGTAPGVPLPMWARPRGAITKNGRLVIGKVGAPPQQEATSGRFYFWVPPDVLVEQTQIVRCDSTIAGQPLTYYALVAEVFRRSRAASMAGEVDLADGDLAYEPPFQSDGYTYAEASILRVLPPALTPPRERSDVYLAHMEEASTAYGADEIQHALAIGLVKNGGSRLAGPGVIDLDYLLGENGGHMIVNGTSGRGSKSSFLLFVIWKLLRLARHQQQERPSDERRRRIVPIILNIKNFDLFHIDRWSNRFDPAVHARDWTALGVDDPQPFQSVSFFAPQMPAGTLPVTTGRAGSDVQPYSWSLSDIIKEGLLEYLFAEVDANDANFSALVLDIQNWFTDEKVENDGEVTRSLRTDRLETPTFQGFLAWVHEQATATEGKRTLASHHSATWQKLHRRLIKLLYESKGVLRKDDQQGRPLRVVRTDTTDPIVVDLAALAGEPELQRFVVATILRQLVAARTGANAVKGLVYLVMVDELNRFAPRGARDPITHLIEIVAAEMRSQGIILLGAQQQASKVSEKVIENAAIRVLGRTGSLELASPTWRFLSKSAQTKAENLSIDEKLVIQDNFREPMHVRVPFPAWAMNPREAATRPPDGFSTNGATGASDRIDVAEQRRHAADIDDADMIDR